MVQRWFLTHPTWRRSDLTQNETHTLEGAEADDPLAQASPGTPSLRAKFVVSVRIDRTFVAVRLAAAVAAVRNDR